MVESIAVCRQTRVLEELRGLHMDPKAARRRRRKVSSVLGGA
jgi:putative ubiquitin-RnfH superfamily antitoxin RatB of RatAB toxin-antitoxin module